MFGHLHVYSCYSFQNSTILINDLIKDAKSKNITALAITDKNNMHGTMEFYYACKKNNIKPIIGLEASVVVENEIYPFILLAKNNSGYKKLVKIATIIGLSDKNCVALDDIVDDGIYVITPGMDGIIERLIQKEMLQLASHYLETFVSLFGANFYIMVQNIGLELQRHVNHRLYDLAKQYNVKMVWGNKVSYLHPEDSYALEMLKASETGFVLNPSFSPMSQECYLKDESQINDLFAQEILGNSINILNECNVEIDTSSRFMPLYPAGDNVDPALYLRELCKVGLRKRFSRKQVPDEYIKRLDYELDIICSMDFASYFLIVWDFVRYAKQNKISIGPGRGSAAGSLVSYVLGITGVDPIHYNLFFERFLNPERASMPDIDIDIQDNRRNEVVEYVFSKYDKEHVAQICTFTTFGSKVAIKDLGKAIGIPLPRLETFTKQLPSDFRDRRSLKEIVTTSDRLTSMIERDPSLKLVVEAAYIVEELPRNIGTHAAGVVLSRTMLSDIVPLVRGASNDVLTQYSKDYLEDIGLLKMDLLGLRNLTIIDQVCGQLRTRGIDININQIPLDDKKTYDLIRGGDTFGVFQLESEGMKQTLRKTEASCFEDVIACVALFRPGPMENIPEYSARKLSKQKFTPVDPCLESILAPTYGIIVYQEQIMQIAQVFAGFSLGRADILRKAVSKKQGDLFKQLSQEFIEGAIKNGHTKDQANKVYEIIEKFANYGFNRSHAVAYALVAYQTAYLKTNYPTEFYAALLSHNQSSDTYKHTCMQECSKFGVKILPPSVNESYDYFKVEDGNIRFSLVGIKNVGTSTYHEIIAEREANGSYADIYDFFSRMDDKRLSVKTIEALTDAGAFDEFEINRSTIKANIEKINEYVKIKNKYGIDDKPILTLANDERNSILELEKEALGVYITMHPIVLIKQSHPLKEQLVDLHRYASITNSSVSSIVTISRIKTHLDKKGNMMAFLTLSDHTSTIEATIFSDTYSRYRDVIFKQATVLIEARITMKGTQSIVINRLEKLN